MSVLYTDAQLDQLVADGLMTAENAVAAKAKSAEQKKKDDANKNALSAAVAEVSPELETVVTAISTSIPATVGKSGWVGWTVQGLEVGGLSVKIIVTDKSKSSSKAA